MGLRLPPLPPFLPPPPFFFASMRAGGPLRACSDAWREALGAMRRAVQEQQHQQRRTADRSMSDDVRPVVAERDRPRDLEEFARRGGAPRRGLISAWPFLLRRSARPLDARQSGLSTRVAGVAERLLGMASASPQQPQRALSHVLVPLVDERA